MPADGVEVSQMTKTRRALVLSIVVALVALAAPTTAAADPQWAPAEEAAIHPGVMTNSPSGQCTSNFVFFDGAGDVYIGQSAHCTGTGGATSTNGCEAESLPLGTPVEVDGADQPGTLAYNSWIAMQEVGETDPNTCQFNDFALVKLDPADAAKVNPSVPNWGGPVALGTSTDAGEQVYSYGNSSLRAGIEALSPKTGVSLGQSGGGWTHPVYTVTPGIPGDSGSAFLNSSGEAIGSLSTLAIAPLPASNGVTDMNLALSYAQANGGFTGLELAEGTEPFDGAVTGLLPAGTGGLLG